LPGEAERGLRQRLARLKGLPLLHRTGVAGDEKRLRDQLDSIARPDATEEEIWKFVELARHDARPYTLDYATRMLDDWVELHGDRGWMDDGAIVAGLGKLDGRTVALIGHQKARETKERVARNWGMPSPEGYAKGVRVMEIAERFGFPVITLVDTPGAFPGVSAEQHGQGGAIARSQAKMLALSVPSVACVIGEGGSGGALALAVADQVLMQENAIYSVISPEGCAMILWRDRDEKKKAAAAFKPDAFHCLELGVIDGVVAEPEGGAQNDMDAAAANLKSALVEALAELDGSTALELRRGRRAKFRAMGVYA
jgi:acetyl-CoA carboxylase carboxyl transferase subunit alpha